MSTEVTIGDQKFTIEKFRGLKAILAIASVTRIGRDVPDVLARAVREYRTKNTIVVTENMRRLPQFTGFTEEDFDAAEKLTGKRQLELPAPMDQNEQILQALPDLLEHARKEVIRLLALLITPNQELAEADKAGSVETCLDSHADLLLYEAELDQLADLLLGAQVVLKEQLGDRRDRLGKLLGGLWGLLRGRSTPISLNTETETKMDSMTTESETPTPPTSSPSVERSSTDSQARTDGRDTTPSTVSPGVS